MAAKRKEKVSLYLPKLKIILILLLRFLGLLFVLKSVEVVEAVAAVEVITTASAATSEIPVDFYAPHKAALAHNKEITREINKLEIILGTRLVIHLIV